MEILNGNRVAIFQREWPRFWAELERALCRFVALSCVELLRASVGSIHVIQSVENSTFFVRLRRHLHACDTASPSPSTPARTRDSNSSSCSPSTRMSHSPQPMHFPKKFLTFLKRERSELAGDSRSACSQYCIHNVMALPVGCRSKCVVVWTISISSDVKPR